MSVQNFTLLLLFVTLTLIHAQISEFAIRPNENGTVAIDVAAPDAQAVAFVEFQSPMFHPYDPDAMCPFSKLDDSDSALRMLVKKYNEMEKPYRPPNGQRVNETNFDPINMIVSLWIANLGEVEENRNHFTINGGLDLYYYPTFKWNRGRFCGLNRLDLYNDLEDFYNPVRRSSYIVDRQQLAPPSIYILNGAIEYNAWGFSKTTLICNFDPRYYPYDYQLCTVDIRYRIPRQYHVNVTDVTCSKHTFKALNPAWILLACDGTFNRSGDYLVTEFRFLMERNSGMAIVTSIGPSMLIALSNPLIFIIPSDIPASGCDMGVAFLIVLFVYLSVVTQSLPQTGGVSDQPYYVYYIILLLCMNVIATMVAGFLLRVKSEKAVRRANLIAFITMVAVEAVLTFFFISFLNLSPRPECQNLGTGITDCIYQGQRIRTVPTPNDQMLDLNQ